LSRLLETERCPRRAAVGVSWRDGSQSRSPQQASMLDPERGFDDVGFRLVRELDAGQ
jgi:hypothetical protein